MRFIILNKFLGRFITGIFACKRAISAVKRVHFVSDPMTYTIPRGHWCHNIALYIHAPTEDKIDYVKDNLCEELEHIFHKFLKYRMKMLLRYLKANVLREAIFEPTIGNRNIHEISIDNGVRVLSIAFECLIIQDSRFILTTIWCWQKLGRG
jgi:hypothetical protein